MEKRIIVVQNVFDDPNHTTQSIESIRLAAKRWNADFYELNTIQFPDSPNPFFWDRIWEYENFINYDKVVIVDPDVIINVKSPDLFEELTPDFDICLVKDGNPGGRFPDHAYFKNSISRHCAFLGDTIPIFSRNITGFSEEEYWENYFNVGVNVFYPKKIAPVMQDLKKLILNNSEIHKYLDFKNGGVWFSSQNIFNALFISKGIKIKFLGDEWNWIAPDISEEYNENLYLGPMKPWIYHFTGTNGCKDELKKYDRWK